jgi:hypothetical protein
MVDSRSGRDCEPHCGASLHDLNALNFQMFLHVSVRDCEPHWGRKRQKTAQLERPARDLKY